MTNQTQTDRLAEVLENLRHMTAEMRGNYDGEYDHWANRIDTAADVAQSLSTDLANAEARVKELFAANAMNLKRAHAAEARLKQLDQVKSCISPSALTTGKESA